MTVSSTSEPSFPLPPDLLEVSLSEMAERLLALPPDAAHARLKGRVEALRREFEALRARPTPRVVTFVDDVIAIEAELAALWVDDGKPAYTTTLWRARAYSSARAS